MSSHDTDSPLTPPFADPAVGVTTAKKPSSPLRANATTIEDLQSRFTASSLQDEADDAETPASSATSSEEGGGGGGERTERQKGTRPQRVNLAELRTATMFEPRDAAQQNRNKAPRDWTVPHVRNGHGRVKRAATLFLGKDHERWQQYERERMDASGSAGLRVAWRAGTSSTVQVGSGSALNWDSEDDEDDDEDAYTEFTSETESDVAPSLGGGSSNGATASRRSSMRRRSSSRGSKSQGTKGFPRIVQSGRRESIAESTSPSSTYSFDGTSSSSGTRPRRFSSNGPEAAFLRHETVIGIHTPRRDSSSSNASASGNALRQASSSNLERIALAPLSQIRTPASGTESVVAPVPGGSPSRRGSKVIKSSSSSEVLAQAAEAAAAAVSKQRREERSVSTSMTDEEDKLASNEKGSSHYRSMLGAQKHHRAVSPSKALKLAPRRKPIRVEGTLYDRSGPFREGAVTDGLCVRFFSAEDVSEHAAYEQPHKRHRNGGGGGGSGKHEAFSTSAVVDEEMVPTTYLITTPDNRVSSAAKLRRWAMDGEGRFYAAMEIKSVEAKMRAADPSMTGGGGISKSLLRELRQRYLNDLLDEVQKTETLNPGREAVAHVLCTSDNKYLRLEEDYPEEAFFVIAGCDEEELTPVVSLVFAKALRAIAGFHAAGWLHGDIKLENLMFDEQGRLVVIDYENANPFRGVPGSDGRVTLVSYDWVPPEAFPGPHGRRAGPSADLWALGCNMIRAFALRDNVEDVDIRETLLGKGQQSFLQYRRTTLLRRRDSANGQPRRRGSDVGIPGSSTRPLPTADDVDLSSLLVDSTDSKCEGSDEDGQPADNGWHGAQMLPPSPGPTPQRLLGRFAREAPDLLKLVIARCVSDLPEERSVEAEMECLRFVELLEREQKEKGDASRLSIGERAVKTAINLSGSSWVRPKLDEARRSLAAEEGGEEERASAQER